jgi:hypothetical protein
MYTGGTVVANLSRTEVKQKDSRTQQENFKKEKKYEGTSMNPGLDRTTRDLRSSRCS